MSDNDHKPMTFSGPFRQRGRRDEAQNEYGHLYLKIPKRSPSEPRAEASSHRARRLFRRHAPPQSIGAAIGVGVEESVSG